MVRQCFAPFSSLLVLAALLLASCGGSPTNDSSASLTATLQPTPSAIGGAWDKAFGGSGIIVSNLGADSEAANAVAVQPDGKIVAVGYTYQFVESRNERRLRIAVTRFNADGTNDASFGDNGMVITPMIDLDIDSSSAYAVALQPDGKIVVAGSAQHDTAYKNAAAIARFLPDGKLDPTFGGDGRVLVLLTTETDYGYEDVARAIAIAPDGKIVLAGSIGTPFATDMVAARLFSDGSLDTTFGDGGVVTMPDEATDANAQAVVLQPDGKIVLAGMISEADNDDFMVVRLLNDGKLDSAFDTGGSVRSEFLGGDDQATGVVLQPDGRIVAGGYAALGTPELCGPDNAMCEQSGFSLVRYNADGSLDTSFGTAGKAQAKFNYSTTATALLRLPDGRLVTAGAVSISDFGLAIFSANGQVDARYGNAGLVRANLADGVNGGDHINGAALTPDGKIAVAGVGAVDDLGIESDFAVGRYMP